MMQKNKEYMSNMARVECIIRDFMNMTLRELKDEHTEKYLNYIIKAAIPREGLSEEKIQDMSYIELACLVNSVGGNPKYDGSGYNSYAKQKIYYKCLADILLEKSKDSIPVKLFTEITIKNFYDCLRRIAGSGKKPFRLYDKLAGFCLRNGYTMLTYDCKKSDDYTIKEFLQDKCELAGTLLVDSFLIAFPDRNHIEDIWKKYHAFDIPDEMEGEEDEWWNELPR